MKSNIQYYSYLVFICICFTLFHACNPTRQIYKDESLRKALEEAILKQNEIKYPFVLSINEHTEFTWDKLIIIQPYSALDKLEKKGNIDLSIIKHSTYIESQDDFNIIVFFKNNQVIKYIELPTQTCDLHYISAERLNEQGLVFFTPATAKFKTIKVKPNEPLQKGRIELHPYYE